MPNTWVGLLLIFKDSGPMHFCVALAARLEQSSDLTLAAFVKNNNKSSTRLSDLNPHHTDKILGCWQCSGGGLSYIFRTQNSTLFFPDQSQYHQIFTLSGLFQTCQAPGLPAKVDPIAHFGHFRSHPARVNWGNVGHFLDHNIRHVIARDSPNPTGAFHTSTESVDSLVSKYRPSIINALVVSQSESRKLYDVILGQSRTERGNFGLTWGNVGHCLG